MKANILLGISILILLLSAFLFWNLIQKDSTKMMPDEKVIVLESNEIKEEVIVEEKPKSIEEPEEIEKKPTTKDCFPLADFVDVVRFEGKEYSRSSEVAFLKKGKKIGEITFTLTETCDRKDTPKDTYATYASVGTGIYELKGYKSDFRIVVGNIVYQIHENPNAKTIGDMYDIKGKIDKITVAREDIGKEASFFSEENVEMFEKEYLLLTYMEWDEIYEVIKGSYSLPVRIYLKDGTLIEVGYHDKKKAFHNARGNDILHKVIMEENQKYWNEKKTQK